MFLPSSGSKSSNRDNAFHRTGLMYTWEVHQQRPCISEDGCNVHLGAMQMQGCNTASTHAPAMLTQKERNIFYLAATKALQRWIVSCQHHLATLRATTCSQPKSTTSLPSLQRARGHVKGYTLAQGTSFDVHDAFDKARNRMFQEDIHFNCPHNQSVSETLIFTFVSVDEPSRSHVSPPNSAECKHRTSYRKMQRMKHLTGLHHSAVQSVFSCLCFCLCL